MGRGWKNGGTEEHRNRGMKGGRDVGMDEGMEERGMGDGGMRDTGLEGCQDGGQRDEVMEGQHTPHLPTSQLLRLGTLSSSAQATNSGPIKKMEFTFKNVT
jgi:hypothetical protein